MCVSVCCSRVGEYFQNTLHVQTNYACVHTHMHTCVRQIGFYSPWDFIVHASLKSTLPPTGTKLISASLTDLWHFHHLMCLNESLSVCARVCVCIYVCTVRLDAPENTVTVGQVPASEQLARRDCGALHKPVTHTMQR